MPLLDHAHYVDSVGYAAVTAWATGTAKAAGALVRQNATPSVGNERVFVCIVAGTTHATTEPTWTVTRGAKVTDNTVTWQECTGLAGLNGDLTNTPNWTSIKNTAIVLGQLIKRDSEASYQICTTAGTAGNGSEPSFSDTAGTTTADNTVTWTSLGAVGNFTGNQAPHARIQNAFATNWAMAGNYVFVKSSHAWSQSSGFSYSAAGAVITNPLKILCHDGTAYPPTASDLTTGAQEIVSGNSQTFTVSLAGAYWEGIEFEVSGNNSGIVLGSNNNYQIFKNCIANLSGNSTTNSLTLQGGVSTNYDGRLTLDNFNVTFANASQDIFLNTGIIEWKNSATPFSGTAVTQVFSPSAAIHSGMTFRMTNCDLSGYNATLFGAAAFAGTYSLVNCKLHSSATYFSTPTGPNARFNLVNCDNGDVNYRTEVWDYAGTLTTELTIVRSGGASDGVTPIAWQVDTTANCSYLVPFVCPVIAIWNNTVGSRTVTIQGIWGEGAVPDDDEIWVEVDYLGTSGSPLGETISDGIATILTTPAGQAAGSGTWGGSTTKFALSVTFPVEEKGWIYARVKVGRASSTFYIDPLITLT